MGDLLKSRRSDREGGASATSEARLGTRKWPITRVNIAAFSKKNPASAGKRCSPDPNPRKIAPERARIRDFLVELSTQFPLRALWAIIEANKREFLISDPGVSLYGILPRRPG